MDIFEKEQRIESVNEVIKARWFIAGIITGLGFVLKMQYFGGGWGFGWGTNIIAAYLKIGALGGIGFAYNFIFWLVMRRLSRQKLEKVSQRTLNIMSALQIIPDQLAFAVLFYFNGTVDTMAFMFFFLSLFFAGSIYKTKGIVLAGLMSGFSFTTVCIIEYIGILPHFPTYQYATFFGNIYILRAKILSFVSYIGVTTFIAAFLSNLIRNREKKLHQQRDQLSEQTQQLTIQTQELTQTKDYLHEALNKSDKTRIEIEQTKAELEKANQELKAKVRELEKYGEVTTGREIKMIELKEKIKILEQRINELERK